MIAQLVAEPLFWFIFTPFYLLLLVNMVKDYHAEADWNAWLEYHKKLVNTSDKEFLNKYEAHCLFTNTRGW